ncbi:nicotinate-nucleotide--dimethylbenzimidazole phosphoribosyltransferase [Methylomarinum vadi]|uniref:nicotinate-nucleotide--dimethylbenzimidazole phosphoribosyltransferase n=1 Tax=Methylomarinum vadi TaxID=438855 RepID=UPI0004DFC2BD|nr:nicotinate-nucleotide--dimethylbenzimidazole phosphoribosyltransferase [Methylomarinum vadi]
MEMDWLFVAIAEPDNSILQKARDRQLRLTKPPGSLGRLEEAAVRLAALQGSSTPSIDRIWVSVFAADHGIAAEGVSAFPQVVTAEMVRNFARGGAAVNVLARYSAAEFEVVDVGLLEPLALESVVCDRAGQGTANFSQQPAMVEAQLELALNAGKKAVARALAGGADLFVGGEMGIANTASATAVASALLNIDAAELTGAGTGLDAVQIEHKSRVIRMALEKHRNRLVSPLNILQTLGGFEIAALVGAYLSAAQRRLPVMVDGFIASVAALCVIHLNPAAKEWLFFAHCSHEKGHRRLLREMDVRPLLDLDMRLGEGSGALAAVPLLQMACRLHNEMATFAEAEITTN